MTRQLLVAGGGMAGLAAALAASRAGWEARLYEQAQVFSEVGAGIQLGPNTTRILRQWDLLATVIQRAACPQRLRVRDAQDGRELGCLPLGDAMQQRYGAPYLTIHRADLHGALLQAVQATGTRLNLGTRVTAVRDTESAVLASTSGAPEIEADVVAVADGVWSTLRTQLLGDGRPRATGHVAYRALVRQANLPAALRSQDVTAWLGPRMHLVSYPVRGGDALNVVCVVQGGVDSDPEGWNHAGPHDALREAVGPVVCAPLENLLRAVPAWRLWALHGRPAVSGAQELVRGRAVLLGDAAHPMFPYLAQGAGMAIEDAFELGRVLGGADGRVIDVRTSLQRYALNRWERCARVQRRSERNGRIFHASGLVRRARDLAMKLGGERVLDLPWLYRGLA